MRVYADEERERGEGTPGGSDEPPILGTRIVDVGGGYCSQGAAPVHFGLPPGVTSVLVEVTVPDGGTRRSHAIRGVPIPLRPSGVLEIRLPEVF